MIKQYSITNPAAGAEIIYTIPAGRVVHPHTLTFVLTTSATVANRFPKLLFKAGGSSVMAAIAFAASVVQTASLAHTYTFSLGIAPPAPVSADTVKIGVLPHIYLIEGDTIETLTTSIAAGDQYSAIYLTCSIGSAQLDYQIINGTAIRIS